MPKRPEMPELGRIGALRPKAQRAARLRWARMQAGYKHVTDFVRANGLEDELSTIRSHDNGHRSFTLERARKYAALLGFEGDWLYVGGPPPEIKNAVADASKSRHISSSRQEMGERAGEMPAEERTQLAALIHRFHEENRRENAEHADAGEARATRILEMQATSEQHLEHIVILMQELLRRFGGEPPPAPARRRPPEPGEPGFKERRRKPS